MVASAAPPRRPGKILTSIFVVVSLGLGPIVAQSADAAEPAASRPMQLDADCPQRWPIEHPVGTDNPAELRYLEYVNLCSDFGEQEFVYNNGTDVVLILSETFTGTIWDSDLADEIFREAFPPSTYGTLILPGESVEILSPWTARIDFHYELGVALLAEDALVAYIASTTKKNARTILVKGSAARKAVWSCAWAAYEIGKQPYGQPGQLTGSELFSSSLGILSSSSGCLTAWTSARQTNTRLPGLKPGLARTDAAIAVVKEADDGLRWLTRVIRVVLQ